MNIHRLFSIFLLLALTLSACTEQGDSASAPEETAAAEAPAEETPMEQASWSYEGASGPSAWGELDESFATCSIGTEQSPIALDESEASSAELPALSFTYGEATLTVEDTGHGYKATPDGTHQLTVGDDTYSLLQFHAHTPSEHTLNGESYPMDVHFVHQNDAGALAVVGVMIESGEMNEAYQVYAAQSEGSEEGAQMVSLSSLLPGDLSYLTYDGSLTTPPCTEGVRWIVLKEPVSLSAEQIDVFSSSHGATNRPVQPLEGRTVQMTAP